MNTKVIQIIHSWLTPTGINIEYQISGDTHFIAGNREMAAELLRQYGLITGYRVYMGELFLTVGILREGIDHDGNAYTELASAEMRWSYFIHDFELTKDRVLLLISQIESEKQKHGETIMMRRRVSSGDFSQVVELPVIVNPLKAAL